MDFWGVKVKPSKSLLCPVEDSSYLHISNAAVGEVKGALGSERIVLRVKVQDSNDEIVLGTLVPGKRDNVVLDLIMGKPFTLLHSSKTHTVYFSGYRTEGGDELPIREAAELPARKENGLAIVKSQAASSDSDDDDGDEDDDEDDDDEDDDEDLDIHKISMRNAMMDSDDDDGDEEDEDDDEDDDGDDESDDDEDEEEAPQPKGKKRPLEAVTPPAEKKIKTPSGKTPVVHKTDEKTTPAAPKTPKSSAKKDKDKKKDKATPTPNSDSKTKASASYRCDICSRGFTTESALTQHNTAKHK